MTDFAIFAVSEPNIHISNPTSKTTIALVLRPDDPLEKGAISGFPRQLGYEDELQGKSQPRLQIPPKSN